MIQFCLEHWRSILIGWLVIASTVAIVFGAVIARVQREIDEDAAEDRLFHGPEF